jgi:hypothetical protein
MSVPTRSSSVNLLSALLISPFERTVCSLSMVCDMYVLCFVESLDAHVPKLYLSADAE